VTPDGHRHVQPDPVGRAPLPPRRRASDLAPFETPAFAASVNAAFDHVVDHKLEGIIYADVEQVCRLFLGHFIMLGGRL